ncbi:HTH-type transcriptional regulator YesS [compost metagenome]
MEEFTSRTIKSRSLLFKLLTGFFVVISLLVVFNFISSIYLKNKIHDEIVKYNELSINHTVEAYENHFRLTKNMIVSLNQSERWTVNLNILRHVGENKGYNSVDEIKAELKTLYTNPFLQFENLIVHFKNDAYVVEKEGTSSTLDMFSKYYYSSAYPPEFWNSQFNAGSSFRVFPAATFIEKSMGIEKNKGLLFPIVMRTMAYRDMYFIIMLDAQKLFKTHHISTDQRFYILDPDGTAIFTSTPELKTEVLPVFSESHNIVKKGSYYYFFKKGIETGFTYVSMVPTESISLQLLQLNLILITLLVITVVISIVTAILFSLHLNKPVRNLLASIRNWEFNSEPLRKSQINEFDLISHTMSSMLKTNHDITKDLNNKTSLLRKYAYTNKLKNIHMNLAEMRDLADTSLPFRFIIFHITFKEAFFELQLEPDKGTYYIREYVDSVLLQAYKESVTFQIEQDQVLSLILNSEKDHDFLEQIEDLKELFEVDHHLYLVTIAVSSVYPATSAFTPAYEEISEMLKQRVLSDETQVIREKTGYKEHFQMTGLLEEEFHTRLMAGSQDIMDSWVKRCLGQMQKSGASVGAYQQFAKDVHIQLDKSLLRLNIHIPPVDPAPPSLETLRTFYHIEQYQQWFRSLLEPAIQLIRHKGEDHDPITRFVMEYLEHHLHEDITLDLVADKLNITPGYLSTYFKEKSGVNFSDYLNDIRIQRAKELLQNLDLKIQEIAAKVGYHNVNSFIRMFKRYAGVTPGEYRKNASSQSINLTSE